MSRPGPTSPPRSNGRSGGRRYAAPALDKGLDVLELLATQRVPQTQSQLARALGRGPSELFRVLTTLERRGYVQRDPVSAAYSLTLRLYELGHIHSPYEWLLRAAERPMRGLTAEVRQSCHLSALSRGRLVVLHQEESPERVRLSVEVGSVVAPLSAASGRLLLAHLNPPRQREVLALDTDYRRLSAIEQAALRERFELIRARGYEEARGETVEGVSDLAMLVGAVGAGVQAALTIAALARSHEAFVADALPALRRCASAIAGSAGLFAPTAGDGAQDSAGAPAGIA